MTQISASVGKGGVNTTADVITVQLLLNNFVTRMKLKVVADDGDCGKDTLTAIRAFQKQLMGITAPDARVDPGGRTFLRLSQSGDTLAAQPTPSADELSGGAWWHANEAKFANSRSPIDLAPPFREDVTRFIKAMRDAGATVGINATRRNKIRAYLMHFSFRLGHGELSARDVPAEPSCAIRWVHDNEAKSRAAAQQMSALFGIAFRPSLTSLHILGRAVDMTIGWPGTLVITDGAGATHSIAGPRNGGNPQLHAVGLSYKVHKLISDPPHWSDNGH